MFGFRISRAENFAKGSLSPTRLLPREFSKRKMSSQESATAKGEYRRLLVGPTADHCCSPCPPRGQAQGGRTARRLEELEREKQLAEGAAELEKLEREAAEEAAAEERAEAERKAEEEQKAAEAKKAEEEAAAKRAAEEAAKATGTEAEAKRAEEMDEMATALEEAARGARGPIPKAKGKARARVAAGGSQMEVDEDEWAAGEADCDRCLKSIDRVCTWRTSGRKSACRPCHENKQGCTIGGHSVREVAAGKVGPKPGMQMAKESKAMAKVTKTLNGRRLQELTWPGGDREQDAVADPLHVEVVTAINDSAMVFQEGVEVMRDLLEVLRDLLPTVAKMATDVHRMHLLMNEWVGDRRSEGGSEGSRGMDVDAKGEREDEEEEEEDEPAKKKGKEKVARK